MVETVKTRMWRAAGYLAMLSALPLWFLVVVVDAAAKVIEHVARFIAGFLVTLHDYCMARAKKDASHG